MSNTAVLIGGQESGRRVKATGQPEYRFSTRTEAPLSSVDANGVIVLIHMVRYIKTDLQWQGHRHTVYVWEHDIHRDFIELMTSELSRLKETHDI